MASTERVPVLRVLSAGVVVRRRLTGLALAVLATVTVALGHATTAEPAGAQPAGEITVLAAASLTDAFNALGPVFEQQNPGSRVVFNFGASSALRTQLEQGAPADVFASADTRQMELATAAGQIAGGSEPRVFARNLLVIITPKANTAGVLTPADLARPGLKFVTASAEVPVGLYTKQMLEKMSADPQFGADFSARALGNVVSEEPNVRQIVVKVQLGEADAGVVYSSDVTPATAPDLTVIQIPEQFNVVATYPIAVTVRATQPDLARRFTDLVLSPAGQAALARQNFIPVGPTE